jgi:hypothetical protein
MKVPDLTIASPLNLDPSPLWKPLAVIFTSLRIESHDQQQGWIDFAHHVDRVFGKIPHAKGGSALRFEETKSYLPLHCGWLFWSPYCTAMQDALILVYQWTRPDALSSRHPPKMKLFPGFLGW